MRINMVRLNYTFVPRVSMPVCILANAGSGAAFQPMTISRSCAAGIQVEQCHQAVRFEMRRDVRATAERGLANGARPTFPREIS
jgi:hypothetical protein